MRKSDIDNQESRQTGLITAKIKLNQSEIRRYMRKVNGEDVGKDPCKLGPFRLCNTFDDNEYLYAIADLQGMFKLKKFAVQKLHDLPIAHDSKIDSRTFQQTYTSMLADFRKIDSKCEHDPDEGLRRRH